MSEQVTETTETEETEVEAPEAETEETEETETEEPGGFNREKTLEKIRKLNSEAKNLRESKKQAEAKAAENGDKAKRTEALEAVNARYETLAENDLPLKLAKFITATSPEEILTQAEELLSLGETKKAPPTNQPKTKLRGGGDPTQEPDGLDDPDKFAERMFRN